MILTPDNIYSLSTEDLNEIVCEMHKDIYGTRPHHMSTRDDYLGFLKYELQPAAELEREDEDARWALFQAELDTMRSDAELDTMRSDEEREQLSLDLMAGGLPRRTIRAP